ncbi:hypothetical protein Dfri01_58530 [Dyadobacter frigoris]|uniref:hypothetical protein n=1 Tax=Dyadobacter frigoris TaxID=2576211 RepID=UPI0024A43172|nr:hypothetical protein [Dyadobacter frigoris]GLU56392.1 hypothetical protein Dfri01_58530 [Dyadobacter frigoris]
MLFDNESFETQFEDIGIIIQEHTLGVSKVFRIAFADKRNPLTITKISTSNGKVWTSIPQGRSREAVLIGAIIEDHFKNK